ncbi:hypothetical protein AB1L30_17790 [Bremerella sp. JC817]|uniref:hypothetical protein n=1 Tax=Bremerella sp. JC817 TaxID=3231756 RepID=UPI0034594221
MPSDDFDDLQPRQAQTNEEKFETLLDLLSSGFVNDPDLDLVRDLALQHLLTFPQLPDRTIDIMRSILADMDDSEPVLNRKVAAIDVLAHMGPQAKPAFATLNGLLPLMESDRDIERSLALRAARAMWKIAGDSELAAEVAGKLVEDEEKWLVVHAAELLGELDS